MSEATGLVRCLSRCTIKPYPIHQQEKQQTYHLTPWDLSLISTHGIQFGLLFAKPPSTSSALSVDDAGGQNHYSSGAIVNQLKHSLSRTLAHFLPLSGRLVTNKQNDPPSYSISIECNDENNSSQGVEFIHAAAPVTLNDILSPHFVPPIVRSFFTLHEPDDGSMLMVNHDGHTTPLLSVQVTELVDGYFIGCSVNHAVADGTSFWNFFNAWAEICRGKENSEDLISRRPILERWFLKENQEEVDNPDENSIIINLPFSHHDEFLGRYPPPCLIEKIFHISGQSMSQLKQKANNECLTNKISNFQALAALIWRSLTRARGLHAEQETNFKICINDRKRLNPQLSEDYFGCYLNLVMGKAKARDLLISQNIGSTALILHEAIANHTDEYVRCWLKKWKTEPDIYNLGSHYDDCSMVIGGSPRFNPYGCDFGWGKPLAVRSGWAFKFNGIVWMTPGRLGGGSVDLEICLSPEVMSALESDKEFMDAISTHDA
ncbi:hypothetical protein MKW94_029599 [Papaver nudicaule]|uniref:HXXXD-type acyl-transferase family protein n=1 Tax=Papaver nudicaule TaxID=74823 RepID=A0AA41S249_PAPNU|nr:hypothetical protein [Papaver nudicaule]